MNWIDELSNNDSVIEKIEIQKQSLVVNFRKWNGDKKAIKFNDYYALKEKNAIASEIGDIIVRNQSSLLDELKEDIISGGGTETELANVQSMVFMNAWNDQCVLEVLYNKTIINL